MKNIFKRFKLIVLSTVLFVGCENHLDVDTFNNITGSGFWQSPTDAVSYAVGLHADVADLWDSGNNTLNWTDGRSDLFTPGALGPRLTGPAQLHTQTALIGGGDWTSRYNIIHHCNLMLREIENITFADVDEKNALAAQAYFFRAFIYFDLVRVFGAVPLVLEPTEGKVAEENLIPRAAVDDVFAQIKADVDRAIAGFPDGIADKNFVSRAAAYALKAEVYMWTGRALTARNSPVVADLNTAIEAIDAILAASAGSVSFVDTDWKSIFTRQANDSPEYIWATFYDYIIGPQNNVHDAITLRIDNVPVEMQGTFPIAVTDEGLNRIQIGANMNTIFKKYQTVDAHDDPFDKTDVPPYTDRRDLRDINSIVDLLGDQTTIVCIKFPGILVEADNRRYWDNDIPVYRWSDMLLLKAEALNTLGGNEAEVVNILNMTRNRAGLADYPGATDQETLEDEILDERARELLAENKRWWDLIRSHKAGNNVPRFMDNRGDDSVDPSLWNFYYWSIDESVLLKNNTLVQSPGY